MSQDPLCAIVTSRVCGCSGVLSSLALGEIFTAFRYSASVPQQHRRTCLFDRSTPRDEGPLGQSTAKSLPRAHGKTIVSNKDCAAEEVEASTRVAILAKDNTPVLLHCSSGVRRTSVFIAIDAVRGKMQKHKEAYVDDLVISQAASEIRATEPTVPVSVGDCEVDVPVAGFTSKFMDVDARSRPLPVASTPHTLPRSFDAVRSPTLQASPEPVEECSPLPRALPAPLLSFSANANNPRKAFQNSGSRPSPDGTTHVAEASPDPRRLHSDSSPLSLSTHDSEPTWHVIEDMRKQRMSLC
ncbi:uncharacterized protein BXZ73DRAFT_107147 [Epithele typhae]|uniref:uncharacterized protein n=1 Tax=Epithele typhae TaxID=378194 RepID=UPI002007A7A5|nr:uncharacterized protein BXZ73DRAFT_107147 [Epithele typhae]KAH9912911.1 hypothetical protein BXZ73DRAFT_107147 [Epithele typhae]